LTALRIVRPEFLERPQTGPFFMPEGKPLNHLADRAADAAAIVAAASYAGFFPVDLETWMVVLSATGAGFYYCSKGLLLWWDHFFPPKDED